MNVWTCTRCHTAKPGYEKGKRLGFYFPICEACEKQVGERIKMHQVAAPVRSVVATRAYNTDGDIVIHDNRNKASFQAVRIQLSIKEAHALSADLTLRINEWQESQSMRKDTALDTDVATAVPSN